MKRFLQIFIGLVLSALFAYLAVKDIRWDEFFATLGSNKQWWYLLPASGLFLASFISRAIRWGYLVEPVRHIRFKPLFSSLMIGYMGNNVLPLRLGEILRAYALGRKTGLSKSTGLATIVVERLVDIVGLLIFLVIAIFVAPIPEEYRTATLLIGGFALLLLIFLLGLTFFEEFTRRLIEGVFSVFPENISARIGEITTSFIQGLQGLRRTHNYGKIFIQTVILWILYVTSTYFMLAAFEFPTLYGMTIWSAIVILLIGTVGVMIPSSPGYIGTYHYVIQQALAIYGVPAEPALGFAIVIHLVNYIPVTALGLYYFAREGLRFGELPDATDQDMNNRN